MTPREIERGRALVEAIRRLPEGATATTVLYLQEEILAKKRQMESKSRYPGMQKIAVDPRDIRAIVRFLGGTHPVADILGMSADTLCGSITTGRIRPGKWAKLKALAKERMEEILR